MWLQICTVMPHWQLYGGNVENVSFLNAVKRRTYRTDDRQNKRWALKQSSNVCICRAESKVSITADKPRRTPSVGVSDKACGQCSICAYVKHYLTTLRQPIEQSLTMRVANCGPHSGKRAAIVFANPIATPACSAKPCLCTVHSCYKDTIYSKVSIS